MERYYRWLPALIVVAGCNPGASTSSGPTSTTTSETEESESESGDECDGEEILGECFVSFPLSPMGGPRIASDLDGDGKVELLGVDTDTKQLLTYTFKEQPPAETSRSESLDMIAKSIHVGDFGGSGSSVVVTAQGRAVTFPIASDGLGAPTATDAPAAFDSAGAVSFGSEDALLATGQDAQDLSTLAYYRLDDASKLVAGDGFETGGCYPVAKGFGDFDGDGNRDALYQVQTDVACDSPFEPASNTLFVLTRDDFTPKIEHTSRNTRPAAVALASNAETVGLLEYGGSGADLVAAPYWSSEAEQIVAWEASLLTPYTRDGTTELMLRGDGRTSFWRFPFENVEELRVDTAAGPLLTGPVADFNGDGILDYVVGSGDSYSVLLSQAK